jgi:hypothetical protein
MIADVTIEMRAFGKGSSKILDRLLGDVRVKVTPAGCEQNLQFTGLGSIIETTDDG